MPRGRFKVVIDPGHGGPDPGAVGIAGLRETDVVLDVSLQLARLLQSRGVEVLLTGQGGHNGFHGVGDAPLSCWGDQLTVQWLERRLAGGLGR